MYTICTKCGCTDVSCEAMINPNSKKFIHYTDEAFLYGWCENCKTGVILTNTEETKIDIEQKFEAFVKDNAKEPHYAVCRIVWKDTNEDYEGKIQLTVDTGKEDDIFFYCNSLNELKSLAAFGNQDFIVTEIYIFKNFV